MKIRTLIVDDEPLARERLRQLLSKEVDMEIIGECADGDSAIRAIRKMTPDLVFLDVQMPGRDGFAVLEALDKLPAVVFVTAYDHHALKAFEFHALDYLLKPFDRKRFLKTLDHVRPMLKQPETLRRQLLQMLQQRDKEFSDRIVIKASGKIYFLKTGDIEWIEASGNYVIVHSGGEQHLVRETMNAMEKKLNPEKIIRIHRSHMVNLEKIKELNSMFNGEYTVILKSGTRLTLSKTYKDTLPENLREYL
ncbi:LytTR family DNA-binding domain-containing protein [bacterium]|nr:LytTR family DNA-binding domain-containing protein [bacterium]